MEEAIKKVLLSTTRIQLLDKNVRDRLFITIQRLGDKKYEHGLGYGYLQETLTQHIFLGGFFILLLFHNKLQLDVNKGFD